MPNEIDLMPWDETGLALLRALNTPEGKRHLGGPESEEKLLERHARYLTYDKPGEVRMMRIVVNAENVGSVGYWEHEWDGRTIYEMGWEIVASHHGRGIGKRAARQLLDLLLREGRHRYVHAFPIPENEASNAICRSLGFELVGQCDFEYPKGHCGISNDWQLELMLAE